MARVVVAGLRGGGGKTTLSVGLCAALRGRGLRVAPFKKGPDYIDAGWLSKAAGAACFNLDPYLIGEDRLLGSFLSHSSGADVAVIEGNRGLFDGMDAEGTFSTAQVARVLKCPIILVVDCTKRTRTTAAVLEGVRRFERGLRFGGVVLNMIAGARHEAVTKEAIERYTGLKVIGSIPRLGRMHLPERHMGLTPYQEHPEVAGAVAAAAAVIETYVDVDAVLKAARSAPALKGRFAPAPAKLSGRGLRIGVIRDSAFQFYYPENFEELARLGAELVEVSALAEPSLPEVDALYIGGGFPETHAIALSENAPFRESLKSEVEAGLPVYAECGGLMYLGRSLILEGKRHQMAGVFPVDFALHKKPKGHGYSMVRVTKANPFYRRGTVLKGHEFHYSEATEPVKEEGVAMVFKMSRGAGLSGGMDGLLYKNALATYTHLHALGAPEWAEGMIKAARAHRRRRGA